MGDRKRVAIAFHVDEDRVNIIGFFYGGQDYEAALLDEECDDAVDNAVLPDSIAFNGFSDGQRL